MNIATLTIEMAANVARLRQDMDNAASVVQATTAKMQKAAELAGKALGLIGVGLSVSAFTGFIRNAIDAADALDEMSGRVGVSAKELSMLQLAYRQAGMGNEAMASSLAKLSRGMSEGNAGLRALGVNARNADGSLRNTTDVLLDVADKFSGMEEGAARTALAMEIFGKSGAEMVPLLSAGTDGIAEMMAQAEALGLVIEDSTAAQAGQFNDTLELLGLGVQGVGSRIAAQLLPTLTNLTGSFLESMTAGDRLKGVADFLAASLKILYTMGVGIVEVFSTVGKTLGAAMGQVLAIVRGDFAEARNIGQEWQKDVTAGWGSTSAAVKAAWSAESNAAVVSAATTMKINKDLLAGEKTREEAAKKSAAAADKAAEAARKKAEDGAKLAATLLVRDGGLAGDFAEKWDKLNAAHAAGKVSLEQLTLAQKELLEQQPAMKKAFDEAVKASQAAADARRKESDGIEAFMRAQEEAAAASLKSVKDRLASLQEEEQAVELSRSLNISLAEAVERVVIARLQEKQAGFVEGAQEYERIRQEIEERKKLLELIANKDIREREERGWSDMWSSVDRTAHDVFVNVFEGGSNVFKKLGQTLKASVLDVLYQMTVRKWIISIGTSLFGAGFGAAAGAATGGGSSPFGMASNAFSLYNMGSQAWTLGGQWLSGSMSAANVGGSLFANATGGGLDALLATNGAYGTAGGAASGAGMSGLAGAGAFAAIAALVLNAVGAFRSERRVGGGLMGALGGGELSPWEEWREGGTLFSGPSYNTFNPVAQLQKEREKLAAMRASGQGGTQQAATQQMIVDNLEEQYGGLADSVAAQSKIIQSAYDAMRTSAGDMADALGLNSDKVRQFTTLLGGEKGLNFEGLKPEEQQALLAEALATANNELAQQVIGTWETTTQEVTRVVSENIGSMGEDAQIVFSEVTSTITSTRYVASEYAKEGEKAIDTLTRLATSLTTVNDIWENLGYTVYEASLAGADAASTMAEAFGGLDKMVAATSSYYDQFYTDQEKRANVERQLREELAKLGLELPDINSADARAQWRALAEAQDRSTEEGRKAYVMLMTLSGAFASVTTGADEAAQAAAQAEQAQREAAQRAAEEAARAAAQAQREMLEAQRDALEQQRQLIEESLSQLQGLFDLVSRSARELFGQVQQTASMQAAQGRAFIAQALAAAKSTGYLPDVDKLSEAISAARNGIDNGAYASGAQQEYERLVVANQLVALEKIIGPQKSAAEKQLEVMKAQLKSLDEAVKAINGTTGAVYNLNTALGAYDQQKRIEAVRSAFTSFTHDPLRVATISRAAGWSMEDFAAAFNQPLSQVQAYFSQFGINNFSDAATIARLEARYAEMKSTFATFTDDPWQVYNISKAKGWTTADIAGAYKMDLQAVRDFYLSQGIPAFATGAAFTNGIATRPTFFNMGQMGEIGPEGILPLANVGGRLGVYAAGGSNDRLVDALISEVRLLRAKLDEVIDRQEEGNDNTGRFAEQFDNWTMSGRGAGMVKVQENV